MTMMSMMIMMMLIKSMFLGFWGSSQPKRGPSLILDTDADEDDDAVDADADADVYVAANVQSQLMYTLAS